MQSFANGARRQTEITGLPDHVAKSRLEQTHPGIRRQADAAGFGHRHSDATAAFQHAIGFELAVGAADRHRIDGVVLRHVANRGQSLADAKLACRDKTAHLFNDLAIDRVRRRGADEKVTSVHVN